MVKKKTDENESGLFNDDIYKTNENALQDKNKDELKNLQKDGTLMTCSVCELVRYSIYNFCPKCGKKNE